MTAAERVLDGWAADVERRARNLAAVLVERGLGGDAIDLAERLERCGRERGGTGVGRRR